MTGHGEGAGEPESSSYHLDEERLRRLSMNVAELLAELLKEMNALATRTKKTRQNVFVELRDIMDHLPARDQGIILTRLEEDVQRIVDAKGSPNITVSPGCVGRPGGSINASEGGVTVGACAVVKGGQIIGGGVQGSVSY